MGFLPGFRIMAMDAASMCEVEIIAIGWNSVFVRDAMYREWLVWKSREVSGLSTIEGVKC